MPITARSNHLLEAKLKLMKATSVPAGSKVAEVEEQGAKPFFLFVPFSAPHVPYQAQARYYQSLGEVEKEYILAVLKLNDGNQTRTAKQLGIGSATLYRRLKKYRQPERASRRRSKL